MNFLKKQDYIEEYYRRYRQSLLIIAVSYTRNIHDAEDLLQSAFAKALLSYEEGGSFLFWINKVMRNEWYSLVRKRKREIIPAEFPDVPSVQEDPLEKLIRDGEKRELADMIAGLPEMYRDIMIEYVYLGMSDEQIAQEHHTNPVNVRKIRSRAGQMLKERKKQNDREES